jgi:hypothetical protein
MSLYGWGGQLHFMQCPHCDWAAEEEFERLKFLVQEHMENAHPEKLRLPRSVPEEAARLANQIGTALNENLKALPAPKRVQLVKNPKTGVYEPPE